MSKEEYPPLEAYVEYCEENARLLKEQSQLFLRELGRTEDRCDRYKKALEEIIGKVDWSPEDLIEIAEQALKASDDGV